MIAIQVIIICTCTSFEETDGLVLLWTKLLLTNIQKIQNITIYICVCVEFWFYNQHLWFYIVYNQNMIRHVFKIFDKLKCKLIEKKNWGAYGGSGLCFVAHVDSCD